MQRFRRALEAWTSEVLASETRVMQVIVACTGVLTSLYIGYAFARDADIQGWQLGVWVVTVAVMVVALLPAERPALHFDKAWLWPIGLTVAALILRAVDLEHIPGGLHPDEQGVAGFARLHVFGESGLTVNPFRTGPASQPALYHYLVWLGLTLVGESIAGARLTSALVGALGVLATYWMVAELGNRRTALFAAAMMTTYHYDIHWSRLALNNIWDTLWVPLALAAFAWGWRTRWSGGAVLAGLALGLSQYFYHGSKILPFLLAYLMLVAWRKDRDDRRLAIHAAKLGVIAAAVAAPIMIFSLLDPASYFSRAGEAFGWQPGPIQDAVGAPDAYGAYLWYQVVRSFGAFNVYSDVTGFYGPGVPLLIGLASPLFIVGLLWAVYKRELVPVLWILVTVVFGSILMSGPPSSSHTVVAIPAICWLVVLPLDWLAGRGRSWPAWLLLGAIMVTDLYFYFGTYVPSHPRDLIHPFPAEPPS